MHTVITSKFQTTIPKKIREQLRLSINDTLDWQIEDGKIIMLPIKKAFLSFQNSIKSGSGDIKKDILRARQIQTEKSFLQNTL